VITETHLLQAKTRDLAGLSFSCSCGHLHAVEIQTLRVSRTIGPELTAFADKHRDGKPVLVVCDGNTWAAQGEAVALAFQKEHVETKVWTYQESPLVPDEAALGALLVACPRTIGLIVAVGSGTLNDLCRLVSDRTGIPYVVVCTAPSVDGYTSTVSPLILAGRKTTLEAVYPRAIFADPDVLSAAPKELVQAGFGDLLGKTTALADWELSRRVNGEYHCATLEALVRRALDATVAEATEVAQRRPEAITRLFDSLILSGLAMGMLGNSRPASGAEHHLAHYWEMEALKNHVEHALHGNAVGVATVAIARAYELLQNELPTGFAAPQASQVRAALTAAGSAAHPRELGISRELFHRSLLEARHVRPRYTILTFAADRGRLAGIAQQITDEYYN